MNSYNVAVVGSTGLVGSTMLKVLEESSISVNSVRAMATARSAGSLVKFKDCDITVEDVAKADFKGVDIALFAGGDIASKDYAPVAVSCGAVVVDNSAYYRMDPNVPLVVPEINPDHLKNHKGIVANPNCSTIQMVMALKPILDHAGIKRIIVSTYQSVSGTGKAAVDELNNQSKAVLNGQDVPLAEVYPKQIAFNVMPQIGSFDEEGFSGEERKMMQETCKILDLHDLPVAATCVRVPVLFAHSEDVHVETVLPLDPEKARELLAFFPGVTVLDDPQKGLYPTSIDGEGSDEVFVGRIRRDPVFENGLILWVVSDNLRKGAATNAVQIAEKLIEMDLVHSTRSAI